MASKPAQKRLTKEFLAMQKSPPPFVWAAPEEKNILHWNFIVRGPPDCPYAGGEYHGLIAFPSEYPFKPPGIKMYTPSGRFQPDKKICFSMSDFHPGTWNPAWSVATICTGLLSFMLSDEMTTGSVTSTDVEKRDFALRSHEWNRKQKRFRDAFPDYCTEEMKDLPNMGEKDKGPVEDGEASQEAPAGTTQGPVVRASAPPTVKARAMPTSASAAPPVAGQVAIAPASWRETIWDRWRWGIFILLAVLVSRLSNV
ncbi:ubiquitin-conjugating enzyme [Ceratobasidium sp. AG-Ba]|nr:ubiquitin-conjugating enzyme [Ceratobasidium sp. AG-Ba]